MVWVAVVIVVLAVGGIIAGVTASSSGKKKPTPSAAPGAELGGEGIAIQQGTPLAPLTTAAKGSTVQGVQCNNAEQVAYHIHTHLAIYVNGTLRPVPTGIGIVTPQITQGPGGPFAAASKCYYWLHTHTNDGIVHIESPTPKTYTLGDFFAIWGQPLNANAVGSETGAVTAYVNGTKFTGDPATIPLGSRTAIQLDVGSDYPFQTVDWSKSQL